MDKRKLKILAEKSYRNGMLDQDKAKVIASLLKRADLKKYIEVLKNMENKNTVTVILPFENRVENLKFGKIFPDKKIIYRTDPALIAGMKIINNDIIYEFDLKDTLMDIVQNIKTSYD